MIERVAFTVRKFLLSQGIGIERETARYLSRHVYRGIVIAFTVED